LPAARRAKGLLRETDRSRRVSRATSRACAMRSSVTSSTTPMPTHPGSIVAAINDVADHWDEVHQSWSAARCALFEGGGNCYDEDRHDQPGIEEQPLVDIFGFAQGRQLLRCSDTVCCRGGTADPLSRARNYPQRPKLPPGHTRCLVFSIRSEFSLHTCGQAFA
jgi:hypothetical protein